MPHATCKHHTHVHAPFHHIHSNVAKERLSIILAHQRLADVDIQQLQVRLRIIITIVMREEEKEGEGTKCSHACLSHDKNRPMS